LGKSKQKENSDVEHLGYTKRWEGLNSKLIRGTQEERVVFFSTQGQGGSWQWEGQGLEVNRLGEHGKGRGGLDHKESAAPSAGKTLNRKAREKETLKRKKGSPASPSNKDG